MFTTSRRLNLAHCSMNDPGTYPIRCNPFRPAKDSLREKRVP